MPDTHLLPDGPIGLDLPLPIAPQLTGQVPLRGVFLPPDGKLIDLELPIVRHVFILVPHRLRLVLFEVLQGPKHTGAWLRLEGLGTGAEMGWSAGVHVAWPASPTPYHRPQRISSQARCFSNPQLPPRCHDPVYSTWGGDPSLLPNVQPLLRLFHGGPLTAHLRHWTSKAFPQPAPQALVVASLLAWGLGMYSAVGTAG